MACLGGGPGGLLAAVLAKRSDPSRQVTVYLEKLFATQIDGCPLLVNDSRWGNFRTWRTQRRRHRAGRTAVALLGDAAHTAHFTLAAIRDGLAVARFKWPERLEVMAELPVAKAGKLDKKALRDLLAGRSTP